MPKSLPAISPAEYLVMQVIWETHPITTEEVGGVLEKQQSWHISTVKTLLGRLVKKGALRARKDGRRHLYSPALEREAWLSKESEGVIDRLFDGRLAPFVAHFSKHRKLTNKDIAELKRLIEVLDER